MVEDAPTVAEHGCGRCVMGAVRGTVPRDGTFLTNSLSVNSTSSTRYDREVVRCPSTRHGSWSCSGMLRTLTLRSLRSSGSCWALTAACMQGFKCFDASNLA
jgi:hypothetical protein